MACHDNSVVGGYEILLGAVDDWPHAFLERCVLHRYPLHPAKRPASLLRGAIDQVVVVLVSKWTESTRDIFDVNAFALAHRANLLLRQWTGRMVVKTPSPAIFVVDWNPEVAVHRVITPRWNHGEGGHHPLCDAPIIVAVVGVTTHTDV